MKRNLLLLLFLPGVIYFASCHSENTKTTGAAQKKRSPSVQSQKPAKPDNLSRIPYDSALKTIAGQRAAFAQNHPLLNEPDLTAAGHLFTDILLEEILPYWLGTPWDFNGTTRQPGKGNIACGYFVTTLLNDAGIQLNRVKLAQCASGKIINTLVAPQKQKLYGHLTFPDFLAEMKKTGKGVYVVGLDFHTGFLINNGEELFFVHSNYIQKQGVVREVAAQSAALRYSKWRSAGSLTGSRFFLEKWLQGKSF